MNKKLMVMLLSMSAVLTGCGGSEEASSDGAAKSTVLQVAFNQNEEHPQYLAIKEFGEVLSEKTNGAYTLDIYPNELLGAQKETLEMVQSGTIAMTVVANSLLETWNADFGVFNLPYIFSSIEHQKAIITDPEVTADLYNSIMDDGIKVLAGFHGGVRNVYTSTGPVKTPEDLAGLKIRVIQSDTNIKMMELMGGTGTPMGQGEVYTAIQTKVLDGAENNELIFDDLLQYEVAPYYSYTQHLMLPDMLTISSEVWNELPADVQTIFNEGMTDMIESEFASFATAVETSLANAEAQGAIITKDVDITPFQAAVAPLTESLLQSDVQKEIYAKIQETASQY